MAQSRYKLNSRVTEQIEKTDTHFKLPRNWLSNSLRRVAGTCDVDAIPAFGVLDLEMWTWAWSYTVWLLNTSAGYPILLKSMSQYIY
jgi:hypothetical protein